MTGRDVTIIAHDVGGTGGMERVLGKLVEGLAAAGNRVRVIARSCRLEQPGNVQFIAIRGPRRPFLIAYPWFLLAGSFVTWRSARGHTLATGAIVLNRVDVVAVHYLHRVGPTGASSAAPAYRLHARVAGALKRAGERLCVALNRQARFACVSAGLAEELLAHFPSLAGRVLTIYNGVDLDAFRPAADVEEVWRLRDQRSIPRDRHLALLAARGDWERKGLGQLLHALPSAAEWDLAILGSDDAGDYRRLAERLGVAGRIHWLGVVEPVQEVFRMADAFVLPSSYETFSLVTFEAAASGLAIIATPVSGVRELVEHGISGLLTTRDPAEISARLRALASDRDLARRLGSAARSCATDFTWERMVEAHQQLFATS